MANAAQGEAMLVSDGKELTLRYDFDALCAVEDAADKAIGDVLIELSQGSPRLTTVRALIYGGLREHHPEVTLKEAGELFLSDGPAVSEAMNKALSAAFPKMAEGKQGENPRKRRSAGTNS